MCVGGALHELEPRLIHTCRTCSCVQIPNGRLFVYAVMRRMGTDVLDKHSSDSSRARGFVSRDVPEDSVGGAYT